MELYAALARALSHHGVAAMFGTGGEIARHFAADGGRYVPAANEAGAMAMGFGYASVTGQTGVLTLASDATLTGTLTGLVECVRGRVPMLLIAEEDGHASDREQGRRKGPAGEAGARGVTRRDLVLPTGAGVVDAGTADTALGDLAVALRRAHTERRPVVFTVPAEFARHDVDYRDIALDLPQPQPSVAEPVSVWLAASQIADAERPILLAGLGAIDARPALLRLAERIGAPLATTVKAKDLFRGEQFDLELAGALAGPVSRAVFDVADLVICVGAGLDGYDIRRGAVLDRHRLVLIDADDNETPQQDLTVRGDPTAVADALIDTLDALNVPSTGFRTAAMAALLAEQASLPEDLRNTPQTVHLDTALHRLDRLTPQHRVLVADGGRFLTETLRHLHPGNPRAYVLPLNFGSTGLGMGAAVGAAIGRRDVPVVMACTDDGFLRGGPADFTTAARLGLDLIVIVANTGTLRLARVAAALGGEGLTIRTHTDLDRAAPAIAHRSRPLLLDLHLDLPL